MEIDAPVALVTGASSGIGAATVRRLRADGFSVIAAARRGDRLDALAAETGCRAVVADVTVADDVAALAEIVGTRCDVLVNNAGVALGIDPVATADPDEWERMFQVNVLGTLRVTQALLPALTASGGHIVLMGSTAGTQVHEGSAGYSGAKHAVDALARTLRLELNGTPVRVTQIAPGMVRTEEFALVRLHGDAERAAATYDGVAEPLRAEDIADCVAWCVTRPRHVDVDLLVVRPVAQAAYHKVHRVPGPED